MVTLTIDNQTVSVPEGTTLLEAAKMVNIVIPSLCVMQEIDHAPSACRVCLVEIDRDRPLVASCTYPAAEGLKVSTNSARVRRARRSVMEFLLSDHPQDCNICQKNGVCELQKVAEQIGVRNIPFDRTDFTRLLVDDSSPALVRDSSKCINCLRCVTVCHRVQSVSLLTQSSRGLDSKVVPALCKSLAESVCTYCGQCAVVCPTGAIVEKDDTDRVRAALEDPDMHVVVQVAPAVRAQLGEEFGMPPGTLVTGKMLTALRLLGFDRVFDTNFAADLTIIEEGNELVERVKSGGVLPMITSCSPGWIKFAEHFFPDCLDHLSTCKSPQQMFGALAKTYYAKKAQVEPWKIFVVSIMPCTAKKYEAARPEMNGSGFRDVDVALTTRELGRMIRNAGIDFPRLPDGQYDAPMGEYSGAGTIFGATGGVMEAALRTVHAVVTGHPLPSLEITAVRGLDGIKEASVVIGQLGVVRTAVAHGLGNARKIMEMVREGTCPYHFVEVMTCPGGCVGGGGQPLPANNEKRRLRAQALYHDDRDVQHFRQSHENPSVQALYRDFLGEPLGKMAHKLLHTHYVRR